MITLDQLLAARDRRRDLQLRLLEAHPELALIVLTVNIPGNIKQTPESRDIGHEGVRVLRERFGQKLQELTVNDLPTGFEAFLLVDSDEEEAKSLSVEIEDTHPLGRLMDIDVIGRDGVPLSRLTRGHGNRRCLLCGDDARVCMRSGRHTISELTDEILRLHDGYFKRI